jgi:tetratricopeptide (TPR) repeat protein
MSSSRDEVWRLLWAADEALQQQDRAKHLSVAEKALALAGMGTDWPLLGQAYCHVGLGRANWTSIEQAMLCYQAALRAFQRTEFTGLSSEPAGNTPDNLMPVLGQARTIMQQHGHQIGSATVLLCEAAWHRTRRAFDHAVSLARSALGAFEQQGDQLNQARACHELALDALGQEQYAQAEQWFHRASAHAAAAQDVTEQGAVLANWAMLCEELGRFEHAAQLFQQARSFIEASGDRARLGKLLCQLAGLASSQKNYDGAVRLYQECWPILEEVGDLHTKGVVWAGYAKIYFENGQDNEAAQHWQESVRIFQQVNDEASQAQAMFNLGVLEHRRDLAAAENWYRQSLALSQRLGLKRLAARGLCCLAGVAQAQGREDQAELDYLRGCGMFEEVGLLPADHALVMRAHIGRGVIAVRRGQYGAARSLLDKGIQMAQQQADHQELATALRWRGLAFAHEQRNGEAFRDWMGAYETFTALQSPAAAEVAQMLNTLRGVVGDATFNALRQQWSAGRQGTSG